MVFRLSLDGTLPSMVMQSFVTFREEPTISLWLFFSFPLLLDCLPNEQEVTWHSILRLKKNHGHISCLIHLMDFLSLPLQGHGAKGSTNT